MANYGNCRGEGLAIPRRAGAEPKLRIEFITVHTKTIPNFPLFEETTNATAPVIKITIPFLFLPTSDKNRDQPQTNQSFELTTTNTTSAPNQANIYIFQHILAPPNKPQKTLIITLTQILQVSQQDRQHKYTIHKPKPKTKHPSKRLVFTVLY